MDEKKAGAALARNPGAALHALAALAREGVSPAEAGFGAEDVERMLDAADDSDALEACEQAATSLLWSGIDKEGVWLGGWGRWLAAREAECEEKGYPPQIESWEMRGAEIQSWEGPSAARQIGASELGAWIEAMAVSIEDGALPDLAGAKGKPEAFAGDRGLDLLAEWLDGTSRGMDRAKAEDLAALERAGILGEALRRAESAHSWRGESPMEAALECLALEAADAKSAGKGAGRDFEAGMSRIAGMIAESGGPCGIQEFGWAIAAGEQGLSAVGALAGAGVRLPEFRDEDDKRHQGFWAGPVWVKAPPELSGLTLTAADAAEVFSAGGKARGDEWATHAPKRAKAALARLAELGMGSVPSGAGKRIVLAGLANDSGDSDERKAAMEALRMSIEVLEPESRKGRGPRAV